MPPIVEARGVTKTFKTTEALAGLDLKAERGQVTAPVPHIGMSDLYKQS